MEISNTRLARLVIIIVLLFSACKKDSKIEEDVPTEPKTEITPVTTKDAHPIADQSIAYYNNAFLTTSGSTQFYKKSISDAEKDYFWCQALEIQMVEDVYLRTKSDSHKTLIKNLLNTFIAQNKDIGGDYKWDWNEFNDDILWAAIAFARGYHITKEEKFLTQAKYSFNRAYGRGWDDALGGGIWWDIRKDDKSGLSNNTAVITACYIYEATGEEVYLAKAQQIYDWIRATLYNSATGAVSETIKANGIIKADANVYNVGAFISAANHLYKLTAIPSYFDDAKRSVDFVKNNKTVDGILTHGTRDGTWQSEFARGIGEFVRDNNLWDIYYSWMKQNADAAWATRRGDLNIGWNQWTTQTPKDNCSALECVGTVVMQQIMPASKPGIIEGAIYRLTPKLNAAAALNISGTSDENKANILTWVNQSAQKFRITSVGKGYYKLTPQNVSSFSLDISGGGQADGTAIKAAASGSSKTQNWKLTYDYDGLYKIRSQNAPLSLIRLKDKSAVDNIDCVLWKESNDDGELWLPQRVQ